MTKKSLFAVFEDVSRQQIQLFWNVLNDFGNVKVIPDFSGLYTVKICVDNPEMEEKIQGIRHILE